MKIKEQGNLTLDNGRATIHWKRLQGGIQVKRYVGTFGIPSLRDKAKTGLWYTTVLGNPFIPEGEGQTPESAVQDAIFHGEDLVKKINNGLSSLRVALTE